MVVVDDLGGLVEGAAVFGEFRGDIAEAGSGTTDAAGTTVITSNDSAKGGVSVTFCVTSITRLPLTDWIGNTCASN